MKSPLIYLWAVQAQSELQNKVAEMDSVTKEAEMNIAKYGREAEECNQTSRLLAGAIEECTSLILKCCSSMGTTAWSLKNKHKR